MTLAQTSLSIVAVVICMALLLSTFLAVVWLLLRGGLPLRILHKRGAGQLPETELAELMSSSNSVSDTLQKVVTVIGGSQKAMSDLQSRFVRFVMAQSELVRKHQGRGDKLVQSLIDIVDHIEAAFEFGASQNYDSATTIDAQSATGGAHFGEPPAYQPIVTQLKELAIQGLMHVGIQEMSVTIGQRFDSHRHRASGRQAGSLPPDTILQIVQRGFVAKTAEGETIVRAPLVIVCAGQSKGHAGDTGPPPSSSVQTLSTGEGT